MGSVIENSSKADNEDKFGRNEEEQIGADDNEEELPSSVAIDDEKITIFQRKFRATLNKLNGFLSIERNAGIPAALGVLILTYKIRTKEALASLISDDLLMELRQILFKHLFSDEDRFFTKAELDSIYGADEWGRLLGYTIWLAYYSRVSLRSKLPVSASREEKDNLRWDNACWLYLAQRLKHDPLSKETASQLILACGEDGAKNWYDTFLEYGILLDENSTSIYDDIKGFELASSSNAFDGKRLVVENGTHITLASICGPGITSKYKKEFLKLQRSTAA